MLKRREAELVRRFPAIAWTEPIAVRVMPSLPSQLGVERLGCRFCIALIGLKGKDVWKLPQTREEFDAHIKEHHAD